MEKQTTKRTASKSPRKKGKRSDIARLAPTNLKAQERQFFQADCQANPTFEYPSRPPVLANSAFLGELLPTAVAILDKCLADFGSESNFLASDGGELLDQGQTEECIREYMEGLNLPCTYQIVFSETAIAPTSVVHRDSDNVAIITCAVPLVYRRNRILGVLHHEIGTHLLRSLNEKLQVWYKKRNMYKLQPYAKTEEGLACINTQYEAAVAGRKCYLWSAALHYYAICKAQELSFVELFRDLAQYVDDPFRRWKECVRVKRGLVDTTLKGGCVRDVVYLEGAVEILRRRTELDFHKLYSGKLTLADLSRPEIARRCKDGLLPSFLEDLPKYLSALDRVAEVNGIVI